MRASAFALLALLLLGAPAALAAAGAAPSIVLVTMDTTRADHLGCYGDPAMGTPFVDRTSRRGTLFQEAYAAAPLTLPSHATMLTGLSPLRAGVRDNGIDRVPASVNTVAELLGKAGYDNRAFVSSAVLDRAFGLDQGFAVYDDDVRVGRPEAFNYEERATSQTDAAMVARLDAPRAGKAPLFLWLHFYDPHLPYVPPRPFDALQQGDPYRGEIAFLDWGIAIAAAELRKAGVADPAMILASDHGEGLGDHGEQTHGVLLHEESMRVALVLVAPGVERGATRPGLVGLADVAPTILEIGGVPRPKALDGRSLLPVAQGGPARAQLLEETLFPHNSFGWAKSFGVRDARWHFVTPPGLLYDRDADPAERRDAAAENAPLVRRFEEAVRILDAAPRTAPERAEVDPSLQAQIESLGYVGAGAESSKLPPERALELLQLLEQARQKAAEGDLASAETLARQVVEANPQNVQALALLARAQRAGGRPQEAVKSYEQALAVRKLDYLEVGLGDTLASMDDLDGAIAHYRAAVALQPRHVPAYLSWARLLFVSGRFAELGPMLDAALAAGVRDPALFVLRGRVAGEAGDLPRAIELFNEALKQDPTSAEALLDLGKASFHAERIDDAVLAYERYVALHPDDVATLRTLGAIYLELRGDRARARELFGHALSLMPPGQEREELFEIYSAIPPVQR